jgi:DNA-binding NarL/FixJ family response regulator
MSVEISAIASVMSARHLLIFIPPGEHSTAQARDASAREAAWAPVGGTGVARPRLTKRERELITLVAAGGQSAGMAEDLFLSTETVKTHVQNAMTKLGARTRAHAVALALVTGQIMWSMRDAPPPAVPPGDRAPPA